MNTTLLDGTKIMGIGEDGWHRNCLIVGQVGTGKTVASEVMMEHCLNKNKKVLHIDPHNEGWSLVSRYGGVNMMIRDALTDNFDAFFTNVYVSFETGSHDHSVEAVFELINRVITDKKVDVVVVDEGHWLLSPEHIQEFTTVIEKASEQNIAVHVVTQTGILEYLEDEIKERFIKQFDMLITFGKIGSLNTDKKDLKRYEALVIDKETGVSEKVRFK